MGGQRRIRGWGGEVVEGEGSGLKSSGELSDWGSGRGVGVRRKFFSEASL